MINSFRIGIFTWALMASSSSASPQAQGENPQPSRIPEAEGVNVVILNRDRNWLDLESEATLMKE